MNKANISEKSDTPNVNQYIHPLQGTSTEKLETHRKQLSPNDKTYTNRRQILLDAHASSPKFKVKPKNNKNSSQVDTHSQKTSGSLEKNNGLKNSSNITDSDIKESNEISSDDEDSIVSDPDSSEDDLDFLMKDETREAVEKRLMKGDTIRKKGDYKRQEEKETKAVNEARIRKYAMDFVAGGLLQLTSFGFGGFATIGNGNRWLFPVVVPFLNELFSEKIAQLTRTSTLVIPETQQWFAIQRQLGHALGDLFVACANKDPSKKFEIKVNDETKKVTAAEALRHVGWRGVGKAWGKNFLVRGLPFAWFSLLYAIRDWQLYDAHGGYFSGNATEWCHSHTPNANCSNVEQATGDINPVMLRTGIVFLVGMLAGAATSLTGQLIASQMAGVKEKPNFSTDYYVKKMAYLESLKLDIRDYINDTLAPPDKDLKKTDKNLYDYKYSIYKKNFNAVLDLEIAVDKDISYAKKKSSLWTTYLAELDLATQKKRDSTMVTPEFGSKRIDTGMAFIGKILSLILYVVIIQRFSPQNPHTSERDRELSLILPPLMLIFIAGFAHRDDLRLIPQATYGAGKGIVRACKGSAKQAHGNDHPTQAENDHVVNMEGALNDVSDSEEEKEPYLSNGLTNPDGTPVVEEKGGGKHARFTSQHDEDGDSLT